MMKTELVKNAIDNLIAMFRDQQFPTELGWQLIRRRKGDTPIPSDSWSAGNRWIMLASGTTMAMGFGQWHNQFGRRVKPGSKAFYIFAPLTRQLKTEDDAGCESIRPVLTGFRLIPVFRLQDTDGKPLPAQATITPAILPPLFGVAEKLGLTVKWQPFDGRALGRYRPGTKEVLLSEKSALNFYHEVMHHLDSQIEPIRAGRLCEAELIAEFGAQALCSIQGITGYEASSYDYLKSYAAGKDPESVLKSIMSVAARVELLVGKFLDAAELELPATPDNCAPAASISA